MSHAKNINWLPNEINWTFNNFLFLKKQHNEPIKMKLTYAFPQIIVILNCILLIIFFLFPYIVYLFTIEIEFNIYTQYCESYKYSFKIRLFKHAL